MALGDLGLCGVMGYQARANSFNQLTGAGMAQHAAYERSKADLEFFRLQQQISMEQFRQYIQPEKAKETEVATPNEVLPDISLTRVLKWAIVLLVAMALGRRVWDQFGEKITKQVHKALDSSIGEAS